MAYRGDCLSVAVALAGGECRGSYAVDSLANTIGCHDMPWLAKPRQGHGNPRQGPWQAPPQAAASPTANGNK